MMLRRVFLVAAMAFGVFTASAGSARADIDPQQAKDMIVKLSKQAVEVMTGKGIPDGERIERFRTLFISSVDLPGISRFVLARHWKIATPDQQQDFMKLFEDMLVYTWANRFKDASDKVGVNVIGTKPDGDQGLIVDSAIIREGQEPIPVLWRLRQAEGGLRILDLLIEGTSMVVTYREEYASVINQNGGNIDGLLDTLRKKTISMAQQQAAGKTN